MWLRYRPNAGQSTLFRLAYDFFAVPDAVDLLTRLTQTILAYCPDARFAERFDSETENWYEWSGLKYFLYEYEQHLADLARVSVRMPWEEVAKMRREETIEHILPQTPGVAYWTDRFTLEMRERWTHDIGNLTLTYDNSELGNKPFPAKKGTPTTPRRYASSVLLVERQVASYDDWTEVEILQRRDEIKTWALQRWHVEPLLVPSQSHPDNGKSSPTPSTAWERLLQIADGHGVKAEFVQLVQAAERYPLYARMQINWGGVCYTPPNQRNETRLMWICPDLYVSVGFECLERYFGISSHDAKEILGLDGRQVLEKSDVNDFIARLDQLFADYNAERWPKPAEPERPPAEIEMSPEKRLIQKADELGNGAEFRAILEAAAAFPVYKRTNKNWRVIKYTPLENKQEGLFWIAPTLWFAITYKDGVSNFERFYEIPTREVEAILGTKEVTLDRHEVTDFLDKLNRVFNRIAKTA